MKKVILGIAIAIVLGVVGYFFLVGRESPDPRLEIAPFNPRSEVEEANNEGLFGKRYLGYSTEVLDSNKDRRRVLFFYANWCPTCRPANADFMKNESQIPEDLVVIRVNYNDSDTDEEEKNLASQYGVTYQHTYVQIDRDGNEVTKWNGGQTSELLKNIQ